MTVPDDGAGRTLNSLAPFAFLPGSHCVSVTGTPENFWFAGAGLPEQFTRKPAAMGWVSKKDTAPAAAAPSGKSGMSHRRA